MKCTTPRLLCSFLCTALLIGAVPTRASSILFIGNSFTFAYGSPVRFYRANSVSDLNSDGQGGVPALFKSFTSEAGLDYEVSMETWPGVGLEWHLEHKLPLIGQKPWDNVVMHGYSTLDAKHPGNSDLLVRSVKQMSEFLKAHSPHVTVRLMATWPRADLTYLLGGAWYGKPIEAMANDVRSGYERAARSSGIEGIIPVGDAWLRAMHSGVADVDPYDGIDAGKLDLWTYDGYHASVYGSYLEALMVFGGVTQLDPRVLGVGECSGFELGLSSAQVGSLEQVAFDQLAAEGLVKPSPSIGRSVPAKCRAP
jgi:hypothetical protein